MLRTNGFFHLALFKVLLLAFIQSPIEFSLEALVFALCPSGLALGKEGQVKEHQPGEILQL